MCVHVCVCVCVCVCMHVFNIHAHIASLYTQYRHAMAVLLSCSQLLREFQRYKELVRRPSFSKELIPERYSLSKQAS